MVLPISSIAAVWDINGRFELTETYNDNIFLSESINEKSDYITQINPGMTVDAKGRQATLALNYIMQNIRYSKESSYDDTFHRLNANVNTIILPELFYIDASASHTQQILNRNISVPADNLTVSDNRTEVNLATISPYIKTQIGLNTMGELRYSEQWIDYSETSVSDTNDQSIYAELRSKVSNDLLLGFNYEKHNINSETEYDSWLEETGINVDYMITGRLSGLAGAGYEKNEYDQLDGIRTEKGNTWYLGIRWGLSPHTLISARYGERAFGKAKSVDLVHELRKWQWNINYNEDYTTSAGTLLSNQLTGEIDEDIVHAGDPQPVSEVILSRNTSVRGIRNFGKLDIDISFFIRDREYRLTKEVEKIYGGDLEAIWTILPRTDVTLSVSKERDDLQSGQIKNIILSEGVSIDRDITRNSNLKLTYRYYEYQSFRNIKQEYKQNQVSIAYNMSF
ncbi:MAG: TIGR03016 family PEP-CTERM system-associated outer membrane protein [Gammaproteobacteria bacterium]|nr:TIGR03016 family PEP-CTERM system-associated outer membrane protein [Gammaproteobacteria bacterium]